jgi:hypothetical protein
VPRPWVDPHPDEAPKERDERPLLKRRARAHGVFFRRPLRARARLRKSPTLVGAGLKSPGEALPWSKAGASTEFPCKRYAVGRTARPTAQRQSAGWPECRVGRARPEKQHGRGAGVLEPTPPGSAQGSIGLAVSGIEDRSTASRRRSRRPAVHGPAPPRSCFRGPIQACLRMVTAWCRPKDARVPGMTPATTRAMNRPVGRQSRDCSRGARIIM